VKPVVRNFAALAVLLAPAPHSNTIRARKATDRTLRDCLAIGLNSVRCSGNSQLMLFRASTSRLHIST
jgi:hypothetical protein